MKRGAQPVVDPNPIDQVALAGLAERAIAGDVVRTNSIPELCALLDLLKACGYGLRQRTEGERHANPWLFIVVPIQCTASTETGERT